MTQSFPLVVVGLGLIFFGCGSSGSSTDGGPADARTEPVSWESIPPLPEALANNAVAGSTVDGECVVYSALGIGSALQPSAVSQNAYRFAEGSWEALPPVPGDIGRVAASAVMLRGKLYVLGGYSIADNLAETTHEEVDVYDPATGEWSAAAPLATPIDDAVVVTWRDRYIVVVSGWSQSGSVATVQIYDAENNEWRFGTEFPGQPVFGHAGALLGDEIYIIDGVATVNQQFELVNQAYRGQLDPANPTTITWTDVGPHPGPARYRAAGGRAPSGELLFHGGTEIAYNFDGLAYQGGAPAPPNNTTLMVKDGQFEDDPSDFPAKTPATMDHRALAECDDQLVVVGGMVGGPQVTADAARLSF